MDRNNEYVLILRKAMHQVTKYADYVARRLQQQGIVVEVSSSERISPPGTPPAVSVLISFTLVSAEEGAIRKLRKYAHDRSGKGKKLARVEEEVLSVDERVLGEYERGGEVEAT